MEYNSIIGWIPWPIAAATAAWFGFMAWKSGKTLALWAVGGGMLGLIISTLVLGLGQATFIPFHTGQVAPFRLKMTLLSIVIVVAVGWLFTGSIHRRLWSTKEKPEEALPQPPAGSPASPPAAPGKP